MKDHYTTLGVERDATPAQIVDAFLARRAEEPGRYAEFELAYAMLSDPDKRRRYDASLKPQGYSRNPVDRLTRGLPHPWRVGIDWVVTIAGAIAIVLAVKAYVVNPYRIPSSSMEPRLHCATPGTGCLAGYSDRVLANRFVYHFREPRRGEVVVFDTPPATQQQCGASGTFVKRLIALPGETWEERNGVVFINGVRLDEESYLEPTRRDGDTYPPQKIPPGHYFMMGDNRSQSCDSRRWGTVPRGNLIGPVFATYWPPNRISLF